jgi:dUTP pyrophosphatase
MVVEIPITIMAHAEEHGLPHYATDEAAGMDLKAAIESEIILSPGKRTLVPTGFSIALPKGYEAQIRPRSGLAVKHGVTVLNTPGTVDSDYRGEIKIILINHGEDDFVIEPGMRIAQMVVASHATVSWKINDCLSATQRGIGGFGSTGARR